MKTVTVEKYRIKEMDHGVRFLTIDEGQLKGETFRMVGGSDFHNHGPVVITFGVTHFLFWKKEWIIASCAGVMSCYITTEVPEDIIPIVEMNASSNLRTRLVMGRSH